MPVLPSIRYYVPVRFFPHGHVAFDSPSNLSSLIPDPTAFDDMTTLDTNRAVVDAFLAQDPAAGTNATETLFYEGTMLYSGSFDVRLASFYTDDYLLYNGRQISGTTTRHQNLLGEAIAGRKHTITVHTPLSPLEPFDEQNQAHQKNVEWLFDQIRLAARKHGLAQTQSYIDPIRNAHSSFALYLNLIGETPPQGSDPWKVLQVDTISELAAVLGLTDTLQSNIKSSLRRIYSKAIQQLADDEGLSNYGFAYSLAPHEASTFLKGLEQRQRVRGEDPSPVHIEGPFSCDVTSDLHRLRMPSNVMNINEDFVFSSVR